MRLKTKMLVNEYNLYGKINEESKTLATNAELKAEQDKIVELQRYE